MKSHCRHHASVPVSSAQEVRPSRLQASIYGEYDASFFTPRPTRRGGATRGSRVSRETAVCTAQCELRSTPAGEKLEVSVIRMSYSMVLKVQDTAWRSPIAALKARYDLERFCPQATVCLGTKTDELPSSTV